MNSNNVLGIDAGATKIRLRAARVDGTTVQDFSVPSNQWSELDRAGKAAGLIRIIEGNVLVPFGAVAVGAHGCDSDEECDELRVLLQSWATVPVTVVNDAALLGHAAAVATCINLVVGTGSIAVGETETGETLYAGGWGWLLGDEGSAWGIVRDSVKLLTIAYDRGQSSDILAAHLARRSGYGTLRELAQHMDRAPANEWAKWVPEVFDAARLGSEIATTAIRTGADHLCRLATSLLERGAAARCVVAAGGVVTNQPFLERELRAQLLRRAGLDLIVLHDPPVSGAVKLAISQFAGSPDWRNA